MKNFKKIISLLVCGLAFFSFFASATVPQSPEEQFRMKTVTGEVMGKTKLNISVEFSREKDKAFEALLPYSEKTRLRGYKRFSEIQRGDIIRAEVKEFYSLDTDGKEIITNSEAASIALVKGGTAGRLISQER